MSENPETAALREGGGFDPERFFQLARSVGHGRALGLEYRQSADNWIELALPWREELVGIPEEGILASGAIVSEGTSAFMICSTGRRGSAVSRALRLMLPTSRPAGSTTGKPL